MDNNIVEFVKRAADKTGLVREKYIEGKLPTSFSAFLAIPFFGDKKHEFILGSMLLHRLKEQNPNRYIILVGWPGHAGFFPAADEYWSVREDAARTMLPMASGWDNSDPKVKFYDQQLTRYFDTMTTDTLKQYYDNGFTGKFFDDFKFVLFNLPGQPSPNVSLLKSLNRPGHKVFVYPVRKLLGWRRGRLETTHCKMEFWERLLEKMISSGYLPVVYTDDAAYDLSPKFAQKAVFLDNQRILDLFGVMRACDCVLDVFSGISRWAIAARTPFVYLTERHIHTECKEFEIDDLCANQIPYRYIFSYTTMIEGVDYISLIDAILAKLNAFAPSIDRNRLPHTTELSVVAPYVLVRENKAKRFGTRFFKIKKI